LDTLASSKRWLQVLALAGLAACGGGGGDDKKAPVRTYGIELVYLTDAAEDHAARFEAAAASIAEFIIGDVPDVNETLPAYPECGGMPEVSGVDDLVIFVDVLDLGGPGGMLAESGPCYVRGSSKLPIAGVIRLDENDIDNPALDAVVLHEMLHVVGFGTIWPNKALLGAGESDDPYFSGARARTAFLESNGGAEYTGNIVPVENTGEIGDGTRNSHWRESVFGTELMTGFLGDAPSPPLSRTTIESLGDLGYLVLPSASDPFDISMAALRAEATEEQLSLEGDVLPIVPREYGGP
jgi:hypothetical protein